MTDMEGTPEWMSSGWLLFHKLFSPGGPQRQPDNIKHLSAHVKLRWCNMSQYNVRSEEKRSDFVAPGRHAFDGRAKEGGRSLRTDIAVSYLHQE